METQTPKQMNCPVCDMLATEPTELCPECGWKLDWLSEEFLLGDPEELQQETDNKYQKIQQYKKSYHQTKMIQQLDYVAQQLLIAKERTENKLQHLSYFTLFLMMCVIILSAMLYATHANSVRGSNSFQQTLQSVSADTQAALEAISSLQAESNASKIAIFAIQADLKNLEIAGNISRKALEDRAFGAISSLQAESNTTHAALLAIRADMKNASGKLDVLRNFIRQHVESHK